jgi:hypothetical protein
MDRSCSQSIQASAPSRMGAPDGAGCHGTPANLSPPETANRRHRSWWLACSTLMQKLLAAAIFGQLVEVLAGRTATSCGSSETERNEPTDSPAGVPPDSAVTMTTPVGKCPST